MHFSRLRGRRTVPHILARLRLPLFAVVASLVSQGLHAAVISRDWKMPGDGLLTYDDINQREWLDLTESRLAMFPGATFEQRYQAALSQLVPGGSLAGFHPANVADLAALLSSSGFVPGAGFDLNQGSVRTLIDLVGPSVISPQDSNNRRSFGLLDQLSVPPQFPVGVRLTGQLIRDQTPGSLGTAGLFLSAALDGSDLGTVSNTGIWFFHPVPEPSTGAICAMNAFLLIARRYDTRRCKGRMRQGEKGT